MYYAIFMMEVKKVDFWRQDDISKALLPLFLILVFTTWTIEDREYHD
jgi:hypothetical protein